MLTTQPKPKPKTLQTTLLVLAAIVLVAGSFFIGRTLAPATNTDQDDTSQVTPEPETVFGSTPAEIEQVEAEQEQIQQGTAEDITQAQEELTQAEPQTEYSLTKTFEEGITGGCVPTILYTPTAAEPELWKGAIVLNGTQDNGAGVTSLFCDTQSTRGVRGSSGDQSQVQDFFTPETYARINNVLLSNNPNDIENGFLSYYISLDDNYYEVALRMKQDSPLTNNRISLPAKPATAAITTETYTNQYFPDFKLVYPSDWSFSTRTSSSIYDRLLYRTIELQKSGHTLQIGLTPLPVTGCGGPGAPDTGVDLGSDLKEYLSNGEYGPQYYRYSKSSCVLENNIKTSISPEFSEEYAANFGESGFDDMVIYLHYTDLKVDDINGTVDPAIRTEVQDIIRNSTFR